MQRDFTPRERRKAGVLASPWAAKDSSRVVSTAVVLDVTAARADQAGRNLTDTNSESRSGQRDVLCSG